MKFASVLAAIALSLAAVLHLRAAGPDDLFVEAYRLIQEADNFGASARAELARQRYEQARDNLKRLQNSYPNYSKQAVEYRLEYIQNRLQGLPEAEKKMPASMPMKLSTGDLTNRIAQLEADNALLQAKLQEAMAPRPAAVDPSEFARANERIKQLEKEKELLRAEIEQSKSKEAPAANAAMLNQTREELESTRKKLVENIGNLAALTRENQELKQKLAASPAPAAPMTGDAAADLRQKLAALETERAAGQKERAALEEKLAAAKPQANATPTDAAPKMKDLEKERDQLMRKLNEANKELYDLKARGNAAQQGMLSNQVSNLRARLEVLEARKVPMTKEEMALMDTDVPKLAATVDPKVGKKEPRELPPGAGIIVAEAERAFAGRRYDEAEQKYKQVLAMAPDNPITLANLAAIQLEMQKTDEADANIKKALAASPNDAYALSLQGMLRFQQGKYDEAFDALSRSAQLDPKNPETQNYLGITLSQQGHREAAETALRKALQLNPNYAGAHHNLAVIYATQKPPFMALAKYHYNKSLALGQPRNPELEKQMGQQ